MSLNQTPSGERVHIGFFGRRNAGKSSVVNAVTGQDLAVVSDVKGTTTDPVRKAMELLPMGPVMITDTPGCDDEGALGALRVRRTRQELNRTDIAVLVTDATQALTEEDRELLTLFREKGLPHLLVRNKSDLLPAVPEAALGEIYVSALTGAGIHELKERLARLQKTGPQRHIIADKLSPGALAVLVVPIDKAAPKGRLILPQQQTIRDILDAGASALVVRDSELEQTLASLGRTPDIVITDSQVFGAVSKIVPREVPLTSFSILMARYKGLLEAAARGTEAAEQLRDGDRILIAEGCTHHRQCGDIGSVKIPRWVEQFSGAKPVYTFTSGGEFPVDLSDYKLIIHCGGCMLNEKEMAHRMEIAEQAGVPMVNYGVAIAHIHGILRRSLELFPDMLKLLDE